MPIVFSIRELLVEGHLAGVRPGDTRDIVRTRLGPSDASLSGHPEDRSPIWRYGNFEVHFDGDSVWMLFNDYLGSLDAGPGRTLEPWLLAHAEMPTHRAIVDRLTAERVRFTTGRDAMHRRIVEVARGAFLAFEPNDDDDPALDEWSAIEVMRPSHVRRYTLDPETTLVAFSIFADLDRALTDDERHAVFAAVDDIVPDSGSVGPNRSGVDEVFFVVAADSPETAATTAAALMDRVLAASGVPVTCTITVQAPASAR